MSRGDRGPWQDARINRRDRFIENPPYTSGIMNSIRDGRSLYGSLVAHIHRKSATCRSARPSMSTWIRQGADPPRPPGGATSALPARLELAGRQVPWHRDFPGLAASGGSRYRVRGWTMHDRTLQKATCAQGVPAVATAFALPVVHFRRCRACIGACCVNALYRGPNPRSTAVADRHSSFWLSGGGGPIGAGVRRHTSSHPENSCHDRCTL